MFRKVIFCILFVFFAIAIIPISMEFYFSFKWLLYHLSLYMWFFIGFGAYFVLRLILFFRKNEEFLQIFSHELTHTVVGLFFFQKIHSFQANEQEGVVWHSGRRYGSLCISLAPYCLPIFTFAFLLLRIIGANKSLYIFDLFIGFTLAFHLLCFIRQTRPYQTDISSNGYILSFLFIFCALLFNLTIILLSIRKGIINANIFLFTNYWKDILAFFNYVF